MGPLSYGAATLDRDLCAASVLAIDLAEMTTAAEESAIRKCATCSPFTVPSMEERGYVGPQSCRHCHRKQVRRWADWSSTYGASERITIGSKTKSVNRVRLTADTIGVSAPLMSAGVGAPTGHPRLHGATGVGAVGVGGRDHFRGWPTDRGHTCRSVRATVCPKAQLKA